MRRRAPLRAYVAATDSFDLLFFGIIGIWVLMILIGIPLTIWLYFFAPCEYVGWMPSKDVPNRCLQVDVR